ncbi:MULTISPECIES: DNA mismatch repair endonuclease MutL [Aerococcus]|uniref:DNA mismatch repair protein MutL n=2 Tax=Aerococcus TaxID=1375 RepID=A0A178HGF5_9LACT|nr:MULTISPECIES: DNA mismatch repair endonuclease MutL [Aerococcus]KAA9220191.1 DNA mismatch repair endonuclease MutL [Aerococcus loyolae]KAA9266285.1 DNA mismatch repair endonuclease MutL [Aerococcus loyolae]MCY3025217.1 DNA mismatch repair endonuclease MutL [Aerococcus loyolae]MCY3027102.1 DNA mismatch repair endonuclease MutL [Aerococcus loyolae]MCY3029308.1 DNA mismatch repair endonuclease MutL [Aerococcus loyolae]
MIHELPEQVANQIAAGEVVERPASVVKELLENAIDAQATSIDIKIEEAGLKAIQVIDNGLGMSGDDVKLAFKRHATSKIYHSRDLFRIKTLGFRGEALPSIASVAEVSLETSDGKEGSSISLIGGDEVEYRPSHLRQGTTIQVENLFYNTPARLKHIKQLSTELSHITDVVNRLAMAHPDIRFTYTHDGRELLRTNGKGRLQEVIAAVYGFKQAQDMLVIENEDHDFQISGYISKPELTRASRNYMSLFVNGRYIKNYVLSQAIIKGYASKLMIGRYPIAVLNISTDAQLLDVNVHPTKQEIRISKEEELYDLIQSSVQERLSPLRRIPDVGKKNITETANYQATIDLKSQEDSQQLHFDFKSPKDPAGKESFLVKEADYGNQWQDERKHADQEAYAPNESPLKKESHPGDFKPASSPKQQADKGEKQRNSSFPQLDYVGQLQASYLVCSDETGMYLVDQHAAQERIKYEYFREAIGDMDTASQELLVPLVLDYPSSESHDVRQVLDRIRAMGIGIEEFGPNQFLVNYHPAWMGSDQVNEHIDSMIQLAIENKDFSVNTYREKTAIMMSCRLSIKANHYLDDRQARQLLDDLTYCENPYNCPHGRPVLIHYSNYEIERSFKRIQDAHESPKNQ